MLHLAFGDIVLNNKLYESGSLRNNILIDIFWDARFWVATLTDWAWLYFSFVFIYLYYYFCIYILPIHGEIKI